MSLLTRNYRVGTRYGGGFVQSIDGLAGEDTGAHPVDWFYYVNGVQAPKGAAATDVNRGDHIWWDRHDWSQTEEVPAVVGSYPEPFLDGFAGKRYPLRVECARVSGPACETVRSRLRALGVPVALAAIAGPGAPQALRVLVGTWPALAGSLGPVGLQHGPRASGVYARFSADGRTLTPLDQDGAQQAPLGAGSGLIAATREGEDAPIWVVTGTDETGVALAARSFDQASLSGRFAVALARGRVISLPEALR